MSDIDLVMVGDDHPKPHTCPLCTEPAEHRSCCRSCFYGGELIRRAMPGVIQTLAEATQLTFDVEYAAGGIFLLAAYLDPEDPEHSPMIAIGHGEEGLLNGDSTVADGDREGWTFGCYADAGHLDGWQVGPVSTEELPKRVADELLKLIAAWHRAQRTEGLVA